MNEFLSRIQAAEDLLQRSTGAALPGYIRGSVPVLISVPHAVPHTRNGRPKSSEINTFGIAREVQLLTDCHVLYNLDTTVDPNYDCGGAYKERLAQIVSDEDIAFVIDLHGAAKEREFDFELGTCDGDNLLGNTLAADLFAALASLDFENTDIDRHFKACNSNTISAFSAQSLRVPAMQIEINRRNRDISMAKPMRDTVALLERFVRLICAIGFDFANYFVEKVEVSEVVMPHNRLELPLRRNGCLSTHEITEVTGINGKEDCLVKEFVGDDIIRVGKRVYDRIFASCPVALVRKSCYEKASVYKPRVEAIDNTCVAMSDELYEMMKQYPLVEVFNPFCGIRAFLRPAHYMHNINNRKQAVWLSFLQRRLLNMELPLVLSPALCRALKQILSAEDYEFFTSHYHSEGTKEEKRISKLDEEEHRRMRNMFMPLSGKVSLRGVDADMSKSRRQSALLEKYIGNTTIHLRAVRCSDNDEILDGIMMTKTNIQRLGLSDGDKIFVSHLGKSAFVRVHELDKDTFAQVVRINNLDSVEDIEMVVCVPARYRFELGIKDINVCVALQRDLMYLVRKNITEQMMAVIGTVIAIASIPGISVLTGIGAFMLLVPLVLYSILSKEREKI